MSIMIGRSKRANIITVFLVVFCCGCGCDGGGCRGGRGGGDGSAAGTDAASADDDEDDADDDNGNDMIMTKMRMRTTHKHTTPSKFNNGKSQLAQVAPKKSPHPTPKRSETHPH